MSLHATNHRQRERAAKVAIVKRVGARVIAVALPLVLAPGFAEAMMRASSLAAAQTKPLAVLEGKLLTTRGDCPRVEVNGREQSLSANTRYLFHTLQDKRLNGREVRLEGLPQPDGSFQVEWLYTVHNGKLFRVRYFCSTCNIVALEPGNCVCCQQPTELQEVPADKQ